MKETQRILACIAAVYPSITRDRDCGILAQVWQHVKGFPPTPGAVNAYIRKARQLSEPTENDAWARVLKAASRGLYNSTEEFAGLPEDIREIVGSPRILFEWSQLSSVELNTVIAPAFRRSWRARQELKRELEPYRGLPETETIRLE